MSNIIVLYILSEMLLIVQIMLRKLLSYLNSGNKRKESFCDISYTCTCNCYKQYLNFVLYIAMNHLSIYIYIYIIQMNTK